MQALMLAAGMGKRLLNYTENNTKCMLEVAGTRLIDRAVQAVKNAYIKRFVIVVGYEGKKLIDYLEQTYKNDNDIQFVFINNNIYDKTNNIYSLYLAKEYMLKDDTILLESDLIYNVDLIKNIVNCQQNNLAVVSLYEDWMDGTVTNINKKGYISKFIEKKDFDSIAQKDFSYKTVNIYKLSKKFNNDHYIPALEKYMDKHGKNVYYELALKEITKKQPLLYAYILKKDDLWYEIDNEKDLIRANELFREK